MRAWRAAVALLAISVVLHVVKTEPASAALSILGLALLVRYRSSFDALGDPTTRWRAVRAFVGLLAFSVLAGSLTVWLARGRDRRRLARPRPTSQTSSSSASSALVARCSSPRSAPPTSWAPSFSVSA